MKRRRELPQSGKTCRQFFFFFASSRETAFGLFYRGRIVGLIGLIGEGSLVELIVACRRLSLLRRNFSQKPPGKEECAEMLIRLVNWRCFVRSVVLGVFCVLGQSCNVAMTENGSALLSHVVGQSGSTALKVALQMNSELKGLGIDGTSVLLKAKSRPAAFHVVVPEHSRKRIILLSREDEKRIGEAVIADMKTQGTFYNDAIQEKRVRAIAQCINAVLPAPFPLNIYLEKDEQVNASCLLDGSVFVTSGLLQTITDDQQLAAVLAHEYGHAVARHGSENVTKMLMQSAGSVVVSEALATGGSSAQAGALLMAGYGLGSKYGVLLPYSRTMEYEADRLGALYMARAGYDPNAMIDVFELFQKMSPDSGIFSEFLSTHPMNQKRIDNVKLVIANEIR